MSNAKYGKLTAGLISLWFLFSLVASALHLFRAAPSRPPLALGLAALIPIVIFVAWSAMSQSFRQFLLSLNPRTLTFVHAWRIVGFVFLVLYTYNILPGTFALPAGWGDIAIGITAPLVALNFANLDHRKTFILWHLLGIFDLVTAMALGPTASLINPQGISTGVNMVLPLSLIPTFGVPLFIILHFISLAQARRWHVRQSPRVEEPLPSPAL